MNSEIKIISLSGYIGSGKDFISNIAEKQFGYKHLKLAGLIKLNYCLTHEINLKQLEERKYKEEARPYFISLGEKMKEVDLFIHCKYVYHQILLGLPEQTKIMVSDMRFPYEAVFFRKLARCAKTSCEVEHKGIISQTRLTPGYQVEYKSLYIESDLITNTSMDNSESHYDYFKKNNDGIITNGIVEREDSAKLVNQIVKFL
jgi:phosphomevalonate kinase